MAEIKTREKFKGIKALDKAAVAGERMKQAFVRAKDQAENLLDDGQISPSEYAEDKVRYMAEDTAREVGHEAGKLTGKAQSVYRTRRETQRTVDAAQQDRTRIRYARSRTIKTAEIRQRTQLVRLITSLQEEIAYDRICGSWLSTENNLSASIRRICTRTYRMLIFDNTLCYRRLVQDTVITAERRTLLFGSRDDPRDMHPIELDPESDTLLLGCYGRFVAEERACRRAEQESISEECFTDHEPEA